MTEPVLPADLAARLPLARKPGRYLGLERNAAAPVFSDKNLNFCLIFPDLYEIGMSHQGLQILYHVLNREEGVAAHRAFAPDTDMEALLRETGRPLFSLEAGEPLARYDVLGITLPYELCYTNILTVLDTAGLPLRAAGRNEGHPLVLGGGSCAFNPEPVADFFDAILLGDGEAAIAEIAAILRRAKAAKTGREATLMELAAVPGLYVPAFFRPTYKEDGRFAGMEALRPGHASVRRAILPELDDGTLLHTPLTPAVKPVHDRLALEIARGCTRGCRFCQAGVIYRPVRERRMADILNWAEAGIKASGFEEMALLSLSTGDYSCLEDLVITLMNRFGPRRVSLSMPSMRVGTISPAMMEQIRRVRKTGFTVAPEAGSERLRRVINKDITEEALLETCQNAFALGWNLIKLYFMVGLPTETEEDAAAIAELARKARGAAGSRWKSVQINLGLGTFVPKPHTPFQWEAQLGVEAARERINLLKRLLPPRGYNLKWHDPTQSFLEGVFSRGDRRLSALIEEAWRRGARLDGWGEQADLDRWQGAAEVCGLNLDEYLRARSLDEPLPWDHLDSGVSREFLLAERERALAAQYTPDCRGGRCQGCGICDFKTVRPVLHHETMGADTGKAPAEEPAPTRGKQPPLFRYRVFYERMAPSHLLGHLELLQLVFRALRRADMPLAYTQGFNPTPRVAFSQALPLGMESRAEFFDMELTRPVSTSTTLLDRLNREFPPGMRARRAELAPKRNAACAKASYEIELPGFDAAALAEKAKDFLEKSECCMERERKGRRVAVNIRPLVTALRAEPGKLFLELLHPQGQPGVSPREILTQVFGLDREAASLCRAVKTASAEAGEE